MSTRAMGTVLIATIAFVFACGPDSPGHPEAGDASDRIGMAAEREALFDYVLEVTAEREAWSPIKEEKLDFDPRAEMAALRSEVVDASTEEELYYALVKLSNARRDRHLDVTPVPGGLSGPSGPDLQAPIRVLPDYTDLDRPSFFVAAVDSDALGDGPLPVAGDLIVSVAGRSIEEYVETFTPWVVHSSTHGLYWDLARDLPRRTGAVPPWLYRVV